jgi:membrane associated rhomboid family serine protease
MSPRGQQTMGFGVPPLTRGVKWLGIATLIASIGSRLGGTGEGLADQLAFFPELLKHLRLWQPFTYTFLNPDPFSLIFSLLGLWMIGSSLEQRWGTRRFVTFYFASAALAALATFVVGLFSASVAVHPYIGNWAALEAMIAAFAVLMPDATFFLYVVPVQARWMLPISGGITLLYMLMGSWQAYLPQLFGLGAGVLLAGGVSPGHFWLRTRVWWIDRRLRRSKLRVVRDLGGGTDDKRVRGSDKYLH